MLKQLNVSGYGNHLVPTVYLVGKSTLIVLSCDALGNGKYYGAYLSLKLISLCSVLKLGNRIIPYRTVVVQRIAQFQDTV